MSRRVQWSVAVGATFLFALTGCAQQLPGAPTTPGNVRGDLCSQVSAPVTQALSQAGITATAQSEGTACQWTDEASGTKVTLTALATQAAEKDQETTTIPGAGPIRIISPSEVQFAAEGRNYSLTFESENGSLDPAAAFRIVSAIIAALSGQGGGIPTPAPQGPTTPAPGGNQSGTTVSDSTVTVTDEKDRTVDLRNSSVRVLGGEDIDLESGQSVALRTISRIDVKRTSTGTTLSITLTDGKQISGPYSNYVEVTGDADAGAYRLPFLNIKSVEFRRDARFVSTPDPQLGPWTAATASIRDTEGKTFTVTGPSWRVLGNDSIGLDTGQQVELQKIKSIEAAHGTTGTALTITLVTGKVVTGGISDYIEIDGDGTDGKAVKVRSALLDSVEVKR